MVVYLDVLIFLNIVIDFSLLNLALFIIGRKVKTIRLIIASLFASAFSLMIFVPRLSVLIEMAVMLISALISCMITLGKSNIKLFLKLYFSFLAVSVAFNGIITVVWIAFKPGGMILKNSILYFNISAVEMIIWTIISYIIIKGVLFIIRRSSPVASRCKVTLINKDKTIELTALVDTGNSLRDIYTGKQVIITDISTAKDFFGDITLLPPILLPYSTVDGVSMITAYSCKKTKINNRDIGASLIAVTDKIIDDSDYKAIVNPQILNEGERYAQNI